MPPLRDPYGDPSPSLLGQRADELTAALPPLLIAAERLAATVAHGFHGFRRAGAGETFWQFRRYQAGDAASAIDWRQTAKGRHVYVRETEREIAADVFLWRDASPSMRYRSNRELPSKLERADLMLLALAGLLLRGGERVSLIGGAPAHGANRAILERLAGELLLEEISLVEQAEQAAPAPKAEAETETGAETAESTGNVPLPGHPLPRHPLPRHCDLLLVGDFLGPLEEIDALVRDYAGRGVRGHLLQILDPAEEELPFTGRVRFEGMEGEGSVTVGRVESLRAAYMDRLARRRAGLRSLALAAGWDVTFHRTDRPPETALLALIQALTGASSG